MTFPISKAQTSYLKGIAAIEKQLKETLSCLRFTVEEAVSSLPILKDLPKEFCITYRRRSDNIHFRCSVQLSGAIFNASIDVLTPRHMSHILMEVCLKGKEGIVELYNPMREKDNLLTADEVSIINKEVQEISQPVVKQSSTFKNLRPQDIVEIISLLKSITPIRVYRNIENDLFSNFKTVD
jgi:hypothetical protein